MSGLIPFVTESNRIEGIRRVTDYEIDAHKTLLALEHLTVPDIEEFVALVAAKPLRDRPGLDVRVGDHRPIPGGPEVREKLERLLAELDEVEPWDFHVAYETLHPFMDGNGRSGRAIWAWHMKRDGHDPFALPFLHRFYYQTLDRQQTP